MASVKKGKYDLNIIATELEKIKTVKDGRASFTSFLFEDFITVLQTSLNFAEEIPDVEKRRLVQNAVFNCGSKQKISQSGLLKYINQAEQNFIRKPFEEYNTLTSISMRYSSIITNTRLNSNSISFYQNIPKKYNLKNIQQDILIHKQKNIPTFYTKVIVASKGRTVHEAIDSAFDSFDYLRGIWNFLINRLTSRRLGGENSPVNQILLGPIHTLHKKNGELAINNFWFEPQFNTNTKIYDITKNYDYIKRNEKIIRERIKKIKYGNELKKAIIRYDNALDFQDHNGAFSNLWSVLEFLTSTLNEGYDKTISRTLFLFSDRDLAKQILEHLRYVRNKIVHSNQNDNRVNYLVFQLKHFVEEMFLFHIRNNLNFNSLNESSQFLDLSQDKDIIKNKIKLLKSAYRFRERSNGKPISK